MDIKQNVIINAWKHSKMLLETRNDNGAEAPDVEVELSEHNSDIDGLHDIEETEAIAEAPLQDPDQIADKYLE